MNLQQLEYIIAVDKLKNFVKASETCFVTQATLSMMIKKLEEELDVKIFDRSKQPVMTTEIGKKLIHQAKKIIFEAEQLKSLIKEEKEIISGELKLGIIPTLAPYLLPLFLNPFIKKYPAVKLEINELTTSQIIQKLKDGDIDTAILATPLHENGIKEDVLFYEKYFLYVNKHEKGFHKQYILPNEVDVNKLWLLEEGHCMRSQVLNFCTLKKQSSSENLFNYSAGSIETLKNLVDSNFGMTIIPELSTLNMTAKQQKQIKQFKNPVPSREISLVTHRDFLKHKLISVLKEQIISVIPEHMKDLKQNKVISL